MNTLEKSRLPVTIVVYCALLCAGRAALAQQSPGTSSELSGAVELPKSEADRKPATVIWLKSSDQLVKAPEVSPGRFVLVQKNKMFSPHLLVVPVGSVVSFPNADPFFHNVFSLFNGKRFDLGLYEAGSSKEVVFSREGVSYIFCNIHPEMSAVILSLSTPWYAIADRAQKFSIHDLPPGEYDLHVWIEGTPQPALDRLTRHLRIRAGATDTVTIDASSSPTLPTQHLNKFGKPYDVDSKSTY